MTAAYISGGIYEVTGPAQTVQTPAFNVATGNCVIVAVSNYTTGGVAITGVEDTAGNTYTKKGTTVGADVNNSIECWACENTTAADASNVVIATFASASSTYCKIVAQQFSGIQTSNAYDAQSTLASTANGTTHTSNSVTTTTTADLIFAYYVGLTVPTALTGTSGTTINIMSTINEHGSGSRSVTSASAYTTTATTTVNSTWAICLWAFKEVGGSGGSTATKSHHYSSMRA